MCAGLSAAQHRSGRAFSVAGGAEIAAVEMIEGTVGGEEGEPALIACDDPGGAVVNFDDVSFGHDCSFVETSTLLSDVWLVAGSATLTSATGAGRRRDAATGDSLAHIAHGWLWTRSHAVI